MWSRLLAALCLLLLGPMTTLAAEVTLVWDCPGDCIRATGFTLSQLQSSDCITLAQFSPTGLAIPGSARQVLVTGLQPGLTYCWYLTAFNAVGESGPSNTLVWTVPLPPQRPGAPVHLRQGTAGLMLRPQATMPLGMQATPIGPVPVWLGNDLTIYTWPALPKESHDAPGLTNAHPDRPE